MSELQTTDVILEALRRRHDTTKGNLREWAFIEQVRSKAWYARTADAVAMNLWESRGQTLHGYEIKATRPDWLKELRQPEKAEAIFGYCDFWWVVTLPDIVEAAELPYRWGLMLLQKNGKLRVHTKAEKLQPASLSRKFVVEIVRRLYQTESTDARLREAERRGYDKGVQVGKAASEQTERAYKEIEEMVQVFEQASGIRIHAYEGPEAVGAAVRSVLKGDDHVNRLRLDLLRLKDNAVRIAETLDQELAVLR